MIYLDSAATSFHKPKEVAEAVYDAILHMGNSGRSGHEISLTSSRVIFGTRKKLAALFGMDDPAQVVFTANSTQSLNIAISGLFGKGDHVITTAMEHNSVLRPLYDRVKALLSEAGIQVVHFDKVVPNPTISGIEEAIARTREAREYILDEVMAKCIDKPRETVSKYAPKIVQIQIDPEKIGDVVGQRGKTINAIIDETGVKIDIDDNGGVSICGTDQAMMDKAVKYINIITTDFEEGQILTGKVVSIKDFGAFLEFAPGKEGMVHISKIAKERIDKVEDVLSLGDVVKVVCLGKDRQGRISFSIKDVPKED